MFDTHAVARSLTAADFTAAQADALTDALRSAAEQGDHVTSDQFKTGHAEMRAEVAEVRAEIANLDTRLSKQIAEVDTRLSQQLSRLEADLRSDMKLLKFGYGPVVLGLLIKFVFFP